MAMSRGRGGQRHGKQQEMKGREHERQQVKVEPCQTMANFGLGGFCSDIVHKRIQNIIVSATYTYIRYGECLDSWGKYPKTEIHHFGPEIRGLMRSPCSEA